MFELFADEVPRTADNFRLLCTGAGGETAAGIRRHYLGSKFHRVIDQFMVQAGDYTLGNGKGGECALPDNNGATTFADESFEREPDAEGLLCMANKGPNTNGSQFFITLRPCPHLQGKHVVFGRVVKGYDDVVQAIAKVPVGARDVPLEPVTITNCGELQLVKKAKPPRSVSPVSDDERHTRRRSRSFTPSDRSRSRSRSLSPSDSEDERRSRKRRRREEERRARRAEKEERRERKRAKKAEREREVQEREKLREEEEQREREERAERRRREAEKLKKRYAMDRERTGSPSEGEIRFKGRGA